MRRQHYLQEQQAVHVLNAYVKAMSGGKSNNGAVNAPTRNGVIAPPGGKTVSGGDLLGMMRKRTA